MAHTYYPPYLWRNNERETLAGNPPYDVSMKGVIEPKGEIYAHDLMAERRAANSSAITSDKPFFLYLAFTIPHLSLQVPEDSMARVSRANGPRRRSPTPSTTPTTTRRAPLMPG